MLFGYKGSNFNVISTTEGYDTVGKHLKPRYMKRILLLATLAISLNCFSQDKIDYSKDFAERALNRDFVIENKIFEDLVKKADLSDSWNMTKEFGGKGRQDYNTYSHQGIFGADYHRIDFFIDSVTKSTSSPLNYIVSGKTRLKGNICDFKGEITIKEIRRFKKTGTSISHSHEFSDTLYQGIIIADYKFYEDKNQYGSGVFEGKFASGIFIYPNQLKHSHIGSWDEINETDMHGTFVGVWKGYKSGVSKKCIWNYYTNNYPYSGDFHKIPNNEKEMRDEEIKTIETPLSYDQLFGKGINPKYRENGWNFNPDDYNTNWWK